jgi:hypothetical protein
MEDVMRDRIPSQYPDDEPTGPRRAQEDEEEPDESEPFDDDVDEDAVPTP